MSTTVTPTKTALLFLLTAALFFSGACHSYKNNENTFRIATVDNNVCKKLIGKVVLYAIFVDTKGTQAWTNYDIQSTLDSIETAKEWIENRAFENGIPLNIEVQYHQNKKIIPIANNFPNKTLYGTLFSPVASVGIGKLDRWADRIAKTAGLTLPADSSTIVKTKNNLSDRERLIARLRDINQTDNVVLMYFINNYYTDEISVTLHSASSANIEYSIVSFKNPAVIAHEFLHIFGALDLYISPFDTKRKAKRKKATAMKLYPNEVMAFAYRNIDSLNISPFTQYLIGWKNELDEPSRALFFGKKMNALKY